MASISTDRNGLRRILFCDGSGNRKKIHLGRMQLRQANALKTRIESLVAANAGNFPVDRETAAWVAEIEDDLADRLAAVGLIPKREKTKPSTLADLITHVIGLRTDAKPRTLINLRQAGAKFLGHFGADKSLEKITTADVDLFIASLRTTYSGAYVARLVKYGKQFFHAARRAGLSTTSPFDGVKAGSMANADRMYFVPSEDVKKILAACPDGEWRLIIALARYGGLRCPSELGTLTWGDVDLERGRFLVKSPKTAHHGDGGRRWVPIFPELRPHLEQAFEAAEPGTIYVINRTRCHETNLRTSFERIVYRAGLIPWPKSFQNMRASRETELVQSFPLHVVTAWIGNSARVAAKHYLMVTDADFESALKTKETKASTSPKPDQDGALEAQKTAQSAIANGCHELKIKPTTEQNVLKNKPCHQTTTVDTTINYARQESNL